MNRSTLVSAVLLASLFGAAFAERWSDLLDGVESAAQSSAAALTGELDRSQRKQLAALTKALSILSRDSASFADELEYLQKASARLERRLAADQELIEALTSAADDARDDIAAALDAGEAEIASHADKKPPTAGKLRKKSEAWLRKARKHLDKSDSVASLTKRLRLMRKAQMHSMDLDTTLAVWRALPGGNGGGGGGGTVVFIAGGQLLAVDEEFTGQIRLDSGTSSVTDLMQPEVSPCREFVVYGQDGHAFTIRTDGTGRIDHGPTRSGGASWAVMPEPRKVSCAPLVAVFDWDTGTLSVTDLASARTVSFPGVTNERAVAGGRIALVGSNGGVFLGDLGDGSRFAIPDLINAPANTVLRSGFALGGERHAHKLLIRGNVDDSAPGDELYEHDVLDGRTTLVSDPTQNVSVDPILDPNDERRLVYSAALASGFGYQLHAAELSASSPDYVTTQLAGESGALPPWVSGPVSSVLYGQSVLSIEGINFTPFAKVTRRSLDGGFGEDLGSAMRLVVAPDRAHAAHMDDLTWEWHLTSMQQEGAGATIRIAGGGESRNPVAAFSPPTFGGKYFTFTRDTVTLGGARIFSNGSVENSAPVALDGEITDIEHIGVDASFVYVMRQILLSNGTLKFALDRRSTSDLNQATTFEGEVPSPTFVPPYFVRRSAGYGF